jgi:hypothetical protein
VFPSGLVRNWESKVKNGAGKDSGSTGVRKKDLQLSTSASSFECGGLADEDAFDVAPVASSGKDRDPKYINDVSSDPLTIG